MGRTFVRFGVDVPDELFDAMGYHLRLGHPATVQDVARHSAAILGTIHREMVAQYRAGKRMFDAPNGSDTP